MIEEGKKSKAKYWGKYEVKRIIKLRQPVICHSEEVGTVEFMPTIMKIEWEKAETMPILLTFCKVDLEKE